VAINFLPFYFLFLFISIFPFDLSILNCIAKNVFTVSPIVTGVTTAWSVRLYVRMVSSVTLVLPAKATGQNKMPFGTDTVWSQVTLY